MTPDAYLLAGTLVLFRIAAIIGASPLFGSNAIPTQVKAGLAFAIALVITPIVLPGRGAPPAELLPFAAAAFGEVVVGLIIGFAASLVFQAVQVAAHLLGMQVGFAAASLFDPATETQSSLLDTFYGLVALMLFLAFNGHHWIIQGIVRSYAAAPNAASLLTGTTGERLLAMTTEMWVVALQLALPIAGAILLADVALALVAKSAPQMNVFQLGIPIKFALGFALMIATLPFTSASFESAARTFMAQSQALFR